MDDESRGTPPKPVFVHGSHGEVWNGLFHLSDLPTRRCHLRLSYADGQLEAEEWDYFEALCKIRLQLEARGHIVVCYGAAKNVFPSGMDRDMANGLMAYKCRLGARARPEDTVFIFASGLDLEVGSVAEQHAFHEAWLASCRG